MGGQPLIFAFTLWISEGSVMGNSILIYSYAKINLSIDVGEPLPSGMHPVDMIMHQVSFHDEVKVSLSEGNGKISLETNRRYLPVDSRNIAYKAAELMQSRFPAKSGSEDIHIAIKKNIPVAAGLAGGSGNGAAVIHALNTMWRLNLSLLEILELCAELGSDVPFCAAGQAFSNYVLPKKIRKDSLAFSCARAKGTGTELSKAAPLKAFVVFAKPPIGVSTKKVYQGIDDVSIDERPNNDILSAALLSGDRQTVYSQMINVLENYTLNAEPKVFELKSLMEKKLKGAKKVLMSGSGPTVFALFDKREEAVSAAKLLRSHGYEAYRCRTTI